MNVNDMIFISVDDHVVEPPDMFEGRVPQKYADATPRVVHTETGNDVWTFNGATRNWKKKPNSTRIATSIATRSGAPPRNRADRHTADAPNAAISGPCRTRGKRSSWYCHRRAAKPALGVVLLPPAPAVAATITFFPEPASDARWRIHVRTVRR